MQSKYVCINCGCVTSNTLNTSVLTLTNETEEIKFEKTVNLTVMYIYEYEKFKKYEIFLYPGEYSYFEVIEIIKEKV